MIKLLRECTAASLFVVVTAVKQLDNEMNIVELKDPTTLSISATISRAECDRLLISVGAVLELQNLEIKELGKSVILDLDKDNVTGVYSAQSPVPPSYSSLPLNRKCADPLKVYDMSWEFSSYEPKHSLSFSQMDFDSSPWSTTRAEDRPSPILSVEEHQLLILLSAPGSLCSHSLEVTRFAMNGHVIKYKRTCNLCNMESYWTTAAKSTTGGRSTYPMNDFLCASFRLTVGGYTPYSELYDMLGGGHVSNNDWYQKQAKLAAVVVGIADAELERLNAVPDITSMLDLLVKININFGYNYHSY